MRPDTRRSPWLLSAKRWSSFSVRYCAAQDGRGRYALACWDVASRQLVCCIVCLCATSCNTWRLAPGVYESGCGNARGLRPRVDALPASPKPSRAVRIGLNPPRRSELRRCAHEGLRHGKQRRTAAKKLRPLCVHSPSTVLLLRDQVTKSDASRAPPGARRLKRGEAPPTARPSPRASRDVPARPGQLAQTTK